MRRPVAVYQSLSEVFQPAIYRDAVDIYHLANIDGKITIIDININFTSSYGRRLTAPHKRFGLVPAHTGTQTRVISFMGKL